MYKEMQGKFRSLQITENYKKNEIKNLMIGLQRIKQS